MSEDLKETIKRLIDNHGRSPSRIAEELNRQEITTSTGKAWTRKNVGTYIKRNFADYEPQPPTDVITDVLPDVPIETTDVLPDTVGEEIADLYRKGVLQEMAEWWEKNRQAVMKVASAPPVFRGERKNTGIHCNVQILNRVKARIEADKHTTGGSLSRLTEILFWRFLGEPKDVLKNQEEEPK